MPETTTPATELTSQYIAQVTGDLERNVKEQERISAEIASLQEQLATLQHDHAVLVNMQQALGIASSPVAGPSAAVPMPRAKKTAAPEAPNQTKKTPSAKDGKTAKAPSPKKSPASKAAGGPTLVELIHTHLCEQGEPRSAAEVATALGKAHPDRRIQTNVVRTTLEGLVAKNRVQRSKQGSSVFYTAGPIDAPAATAPQDTPAQAG